MGMSESFPDVTTALEPPVRLWLVDDHEIYRKLCVEAIRTLHGLSCERQFESAEDLIAALQQLPAPDLLLLDNGLPGMSGVAAVSLVKELSPGTLIFVCSALWGRDDAAAALARGANECFSKQDLFKELAAAMHVALSHRQPHATA